MSSPSLASWLRCLREIEWSTSQDTVTPISPAVDRKMFSGHVIWPGHERSVVATVRVEHVRIENIRINCSPAYCSNVYRNRISGLCTCGNVNVSTVVLVGSSTLWPTASADGLGLAWFRGLSIPASEIILTGLWSSVSPGSGVSDSLGSGVSVSPGSGFQTRLAQGLSIPGSGDSESSDQAARPHGKADRNHRFVHGLLCSAAG